MIKQWTAAIAICFALAPTPMASAAGWTPYVGDPGGGPFSFSCVSSAVVTLNVRAGAMIDAVKAVCWNGFSSPYFGGTGGGEQSLNCGSSHVMRGVRAYHGWYVNALQGECRATASGPPKDTQWAGEKTGEYTSLRCAGWEVIRRIRGDSGDLVDRLSVYCDVW